MYASYLPGSILKAANALPKDKISRDMAEQMDAEVRRVTHPGQVMVLANNAAVGWRYEDAPKYYA